MKAIFEVEFDHKLMCSPEDLTREYEGSWFKCIQYLFSEEGMGMFENDLKLIKVEE